MCCSMYIGVYMKKILTLIILFMGLKANALTLNDCRSLSDTQIAKQFLTAIRLGAIGSYGSHSCLKEARKLEIQVVSEVYENEPSIRLKQDDTVRLINVIKNGRKYTAIYEVTASGMVHRGEFKFMRAMDFIDEDSINIFKCGNIYTEPTVNFIDAKCAQ